MRHARVKKALQPGIRFIEGVVYYAKGIYYYVDTHPIYLLAAGIAFNVLLCAMPLAFLLLYGLGQLIEWPGVLAGINREMTGIIPNESYRATIMETLGSQVETIVHNGALAGTVGILVAVWTSSALFSSVRTALNKIYGLKPTRFFALYRLYDMALLVLLGVLVVLGNITEPLSALAHQIGQNYLPGSVSAVLERLATWFVSATSTFVLFVLLYRFLAHAAVPLASSLVGATTATLLWLVAKSAFGYYLARFPALGLLYGTYTFLVATALWLYYSAVVFVIGAILTKLHWERRDASGPRELVV